MKLLALILAAHAGASSVIGKFCPEASGDSGITDDFAISISAPESNATPTDDSLADISISTGDANATPTDAATAAISGSGLSDTNAEPTETKTAVIRLWLSGSAGTSNVTNPANANGQNDGTSSSQQTAPAGATTSSMTSTCAMSTTFTSAVYRGWFNATVTLGTSLVRILAHSTTGAYGDITILSTNSSLSSTGGTYTFDLFAAGIDTAAKLNSTQIQHLTSDAVAGVTPAVLTVDGGAIELGGVF